jgi:hypothetical protein
MIGFQPCLHTHFHLLKSMVLQWSIGCGTSLLVRLKNLLNLKSHSCRIILSRALLFHRNIPQLMGYLFLCQASLPSLVMILNSIIMILCLRSFCSASFLPRSSFIVGPVIRLRRLLCLMGVARLTWLVMLAAMLVVMFFHNNSLAIHLLPRLRALLFIRRQALFLPLVPFPRVLLSADLFLRQLVMGRRGGWTLVRL